MSEPKPLASLSPSLLARKGSARPAMRPQLMPLPGAEVHDDLGWNDHGHDLEPVEVTAAPAPAEAVTPGPAPAKPALVSVPEVVRQQRSVASRIGAAPTPSEKRRSALADGRRAAFTLRVDAERHLKLRLACTLHARSAQALVTEALDRLIDELPDIAALAEQLGKRARA